jgi:Holliday junction resolvase RusA-like endonuclease
MLAFFVPCVPPTANHQRKRIVRIGQFARLADKPELVAAKAMLDSVLLPHQPHAPVEGPVRLVLEFTWPWRKSEAKRTRALGRIPHTTKPDCSNALKTLEDRLVALRFIEDDSRVVDVTVRKFFGDQPGIRVLIERVTSYGVASVVETRTA